MPGGVVEPGSNQNRARYHSQPLNTRTVTLMRIICN